MHAVGEVASKLETYFNDAHLRELLIGSRWEVANGLLAGLTSQILIREDLESAFGHGRVEAKNLRAVVGRTEVSLESLLAVTDGRINLPVLGQLARQGATLVVSGLHRLFPQLGSLGTALGKRLGIRVKISAVLSFGQRSGLAPHHDHQHLFVIQLEGFKTWRLIGQPVAPGTPDDDLQNEIEDASEVKLSPGDVLFIPAGQAHRCMASPQGSLHIGLMLSAPTAALAANSLAKAVENDPELHRPFVRFVGNDAATASIEAYRIRLHELVDALDLEALLNAATRDVIAQEFSFPSPSLDT